jgi:hypothetical protein
MTNQMEKAKAVAAKIAQKAEDALSGLDREMAIMKWRPEFQAIMWEAVVEAAARRAQAARFIA